MSTTSAPRFTSFSAFYPFYLSEHQNPTCRRLHFAGTTGVIGFIVLAILDGQPGWLLAALVCGYAFAWLGHFVFEKNRPATFKYPIFSFMGDWKMYFDIWRGKVSL